MPDLDRDFFTEANLNEVSWGEPEISGEYDEEDDDLAEADAAEELQVDNDVHKVGKELDFWEHTLPHVTNMLGRDRKKLMSLERVRIRDSTDRHVLGPSFSLFKDDEKTDYLCPGLHYPSDKQLCRLLLVSEEDKWCRINIKKAVQQTKEMRVLLDKRLMVLAEFKY